MNFDNLYRRRVEEVNSVLCVGIDPTPAHVPAVFGTGLEGMENYLKEVIQLAAKKAAVIKPQYAYFGKMGPDGIRMMIRLIGYAHTRGLVVPLDAKRADIGPTMTAYGDEVFGVYEADACTFVPYLGATFLPVNPDDKDQVWLPWLEKGKAVISMILTSNPEFEQLENLELANGLRVFEHMAQRVRGWNEDVRQRTNGQGSVWGVVGATQLDQIPLCREQAGDDVPFLVPGYGAQGGGAAAAIAALQTSSGELCGTVNSSREMTLYSWFDRKSGQPKSGDPLELVAKAMDDANADLNGAIATSRASN